MKACDPQINEERVNKNLGGEALVVSRPFSGAWGVRNGSAVYAEPETVRLTVEIATSCGASI
jgi:hypothetical protein